MGKYCRAEQATDDNMAHAHCKLGNKVYKYTHSVWVLLIVFPLQQWLYERALMLRYTYSALLSVSVVEIYIEIYYVILYYIITISHHIILYHITSCHVIISCRIIYHIILYHITSCHIIYHIMSYIISLYYNLFYKLSDTFAFMGQPNKDRHPVL